MARRPRRYQTGRPRHRRRRQTRLQRVAISEHLAKNASRPSEFLLQRGQEQITLRIQPRLDTDERTGKSVPRIGLRYRDNIVILHPTPWAQVSNDVVSTFRTLGALLSPSSDIGPSKLSGPIGIARALHQQAQWDIRRALWFVILVNVNLAIFNLLPIPVLDGGQILFATIGRIRRRELPANFIMATQSAFFVILMSLIVYVSFFDVKRWARDSRAERPAPAATPPAPAPSAPVPPPSANSPSASVGASLTDSRPRPERQTKFGLRHQALVITHLAIRPPTVSPCLTAPPATTPSAVPPIPSMSAASALAAATRSVSSR